MDFTRRSVLTATARSLLTPQFSPSALLASMRTEVPLLPSVALSAGYVRTMAIAVSSLIDTPIEYPSNIRMPQKKLGIGEAVESGNLKSIGEALRDIIGLNEFRNSYLMSMASADMRDRILLLENRKFLQSVGFFTPLRERENITLDELGQHVQIGTMLDNQALIARIYDNVRHVDHINDYYSSYIQNPDCLPSAYREQYENFRQRIPYAGRDIIPTGKRMSNTERLHFMLEADYIHLQHMPAGCLISDQSMIRSLFANILPRIAAPDFAEIKYKFGPHTIITARSLVESSWEPMRAALDDIIKTFKSTTSQIEKPKSSGGIEKQNLITWKSETKEPPNSEKPHLPIDSVSVIAATPSPE